MGYIAKLKRGINYIDLSGTNYRLGLDFVPPTVSDVPEFSQGTSANVYGGGSLVGNRAQNGSLSFGLHIFGNSTAQIKQLADNLANFLRGAGDDSNPTYFWWNPDNDTTYEPLWGQSWRALEVVWGQIDYSTLYANMGAATGRALPNCFVTMMCKPFAIGKRQRVATAYGGIMQDTIGRADGTSRGIMLPKATTNKCTNPVFGHSTPLNGWTTGAGLISAANTDPNFVLFGTNSAKVTRAGAANLQFYQTLNVANTNPHYFSFYAKKQDSSAVTSSDVQIYYNAPIASTYMAVGNGWYRVMAAADGIASNTTTGVHFPTNLTTVYIDGYQVEERTYASAICYGDLIGHAWSGTAHASTSTRAVNSFYRVPKADMLDIAEGTIEMVYTPSVDNTIPADIRLFQSTATSLRAKFEADDDKFYFTDNTNTAGSAAQTWSAGDNLVLHFTWSPTGGLIIYRAGVAIGSTATYTPSTLGDYLYVGSTETPDENIIGTLQHFRTYPRAMTSTEVATRYSNLDAQLDGGQVIGSLPYEWTKDGDSVVDQYNDATHDNYLIVAGVPGSADAETEITFTSSEDLTNDFAGGIVASRFEIPYNATLDTTDLFGDLSGTADVYAVGGEVTRTSTDTSADSITSTLVLTDNTMRLLKNRQFYLFVKVADAGANLLGEVFAITGGGATVSNGGYINVPPAYLAGLSRNVLLGPISLPNATYLNPTYNIEGSIGIHWKRSTGSASNVDTDFVQLMPFPVLTISLHDTGNSEVTFLYFSTKKTYATAATTLNEYVTTSGKLEFAPGQYNYVFSCIGDVKMTSIVSTAITETLTYTSVYITPRWALL